MPASRTYDARHLIVHKNLHARLRKDAAEERRTIRQVAEDALRRGLKDKKKQPPEKQ
jgi:hypothetical protein